MASITSEAGIGRSTHVVSVTRNSFPGPWVEGICMILAPILGVAGLALSLGVYKFKGAGMMTAMADNHIRGGLAINLSVASMMLLLIAVIALAHRITAVKPGWGRWGGIVTIVGLMGPIFFEGIFFGSYTITAYPAAGAYLIDHANVIPSNIVNVSAPCIVIGWILLGIGAYKAGILGKARAICLGLGCLLAPGLAAAIVPLGIAAAVLIGIALVPLGLEIIRAARDPGGEPASAGATPYLAS
jgi:hypothetical protein